MSAHVTHSEPRPRRFDLLLLTEAIECEIGPQVQQQGGDVWLEDVLPGRLVVRLEPPERDGEEVRRRLRLSLLQLFDGDEDAFELQ